MRFTYANEIGRSQETISKFLGLNKTFTLQSGEFSAMQNVSGDDYPVLAPREKRLKCHTFTKCNGVYGKNALLWVEGTNLYYDGVLKGTVEDSVKTFVGMGAYILIFPDAVAYNTVLGTVSSLGASFSTDYDGTVVSASVVLSDAEGTEYTYTSGDSAPETPENGAYWMDTSGNVNSLKQYSSSTESWASVSSVYAKILCTGIGTQFTANDAVTITGAMDTALNGNLIIAACDDDYIVLDVALEDGYEQTDEIVIERKVPDLEFVTECNNRVWGCNSDAHEIYACRLGDPYNWYYYTLEANASYAVTVGTDGDFTGAATIGGYPVFFKENAIHKIYGTKPSDYGMQTLNARGVQKGSGKSIATVNETLFYKAVDGIMYYDGSTPSAASAAMGDALYTDAVGGTCGQKYYVSMKDTAGAYHLFVMNASTGLWYEEDNTQVVQFVTCGNDVFFVAGNVLWAITRGEIALDFDGDEEGAGEGTEGADLPLSWSATTGEMHWLEPDKKYISKLQVRVDVETGATLTVKLAYDGGSQETALTLSAQASKIAYNIPIIPRRCDHFNITFAGTGVSRVYAVSKLLEKGSEL